MQKNITIIDSTLRDGSHAISHQFTAEMISLYAEKAEEASVPILVIGHGNGLGASSVHLGTSLLSDKEMFDAANMKIKKTELAGFLIPGFGTIHADIEPAIESGIRTLLVACHCSEATVTKQHIRYAKNRKLQTFGVLMMSHMLDSARLVEQAKLMESYGADSVILMDSAGVYTMDDVKYKVTALARALSNPVGFHAHNNLGLAVPNSLVAVECGATIIDGTSRGLGAGAGNCPLEVIVALLHKMNFSTNISLYPLMDGGDLIKSMVDHMPEIDSVTLSCALAGLFSGFAPLAVKAAKKYDVDVRDIISQLGEQRVVAGQEDMIIEIAKKLEKTKHHKPKDFQLESLT